jgi:hypothetical protein
MEMIKGYSEQLLRNNLNRIYGVKIIRKKDETYLDFKGQKTPLNIGISHGMLDEGGTNKLAKMISEITGEKQEEVYQKITQIPNFQEQRIPAGLEKKIVTGALVLLSLGFITLILSQAKLLTGYTINNIPNTISGIGIFVCIAGILGLLYYRNRLK